jgi:uncharacterized integral membrane protein
VSRLAGLASVGLVLVFVLFFARWNGAERVTLDLGLWTFYRVPVTWVAFLSLLLGMGVMLLAGLHADLRVRKFLRDRLAAQDDDSRRSEVDRLQQDLFTSVAPPPPSVAPPPPSGAAPLAEGERKLRLADGPEPPPAARGPVPPAAAPNAPARPPAESRTPVSDAPAEPRAPAPDAPAAPRAPDAPPDARSQHPAPVSGDERTEAPPPP